MRVTVFGKGCSGLHLPVRDSHVLAMKECAEVAGDLF